MQANSSKSIERTIVKRGGDGSGRTGEKNGGSEKLGGGSWWHKFPMEHSARRVMFETENAGINAVALEDVGWVEGGRGGN